MKQNFLTPLFWQHGEDLSILKKELDAIQSGGCDSFIIESRPFPDFLEAPWWQTLKHLAGEAQKRNMQFWVFDDGKFPSGTACGRIARNHPGLLRKMIRVRYRDIPGPVSGGLLLPGDLINPDEQLLGAVIARTCGEALCPGTGRSLDLGALQQGAWAIDLPAGSWRIAVFIETQDGGEECTRNYLNFLLPEAVDAFIGEVYEPHFQHLKNFIPDTFRGFFSDEPRFGNEPSYHSRLGNHNIPLPFTPAFAEKLSCVTGLPGYLPWMHLFFDSQSDETCRVRTHFMDLTSAEYSRNFPRKIGEWCRSRNLSYIGHVIEENGAHARLGYGNGHYFRSMQGQSASGIDTVLLQNTPYDEEAPRFQHMHVQFTAPWDHLFTQWGLGKLGSSCAHVNPRMNGHACCEIFGAYGWQLGLRGMKRLTDHFLVRGINHLIPHAFSPKTFPDWDCPPHFFAGGHNPQWRFFPIWSSYARRLCSRFSGGLHHAPAALLYHAEAEWSGRNYTPFEQTLKTLALRQIDCDVVPFDILQDEAFVKDRLLHIHHETYSSLVIGCHQWLPEKFQKKFTEFAEEGLPLIFVHSCPENWRNPSEKFILLEEENLCSHLENRSLAGPRYQEYPPELRTYIYEKNNTLSLLAVNESLQKSVRLTPAPESPFYHSRLYHPMTDTYSPFTGTVDLAPEESCILEYDSAAVPITPPSQKTLTIPLPSPQITGTATAEQYPAFTDSSPGLLFSGTVRCLFKFNCCPQNLSQKLFFHADSSLNEIGELTVNGIQAGIRISPPYRWDITGMLKNGENELTLEVTNTLAPAQHDSIFDAGMILRKWHVGNCTITGCA